MMETVLRNTATDPAAEGIYQCLIDDAISRRKEITTLQQWRRYASQIALPVQTDTYSSGDISIPGDVLVESDLNGASPQFTLTCISTGGLLLLSLGPETMSLSLENKMRLF